MLEWILFPLLLVLAYFLGYRSRRRLSPGARGEDQSGPQGAGFPREGEAGERGYWEVWPWPEALVDRNRHLQALTPSLRQWFPSREPSNLLELPFPGLVEFHRELFEKGFSRLEFEKEGRWWRLEGRRIGPDLAALRLLEVTREMELVQKNRLISATLAHEFRTPLTALRGYAETLEDFLPSGDLPRKALSALKEHTERLTRLVRDLLFFSSLERMEVSGGEPLEIRSLAETAVELMTPLAREKKVRFNLSGPEGLWIQGDYDHLVQALTKVLENALRFSPPGGNIGVEWGRRDGEIFLRVRDEGPGVPAEHRERIFEPFFRLGKGPGLGLGLALARRIAEIYRGRLLLEPTEKGASFVFLWPEKVPSPSQKVHNFSKE
ncbi:MAG TPA: HAMP domain-containing histidine kinase [Thermosulfurimonas dismutans]|uniref:histidine kinase n=1 Tax=Thermosulfurimonas dismutans TaxID=999894 RepID=A0A7C3CL08_9BACT|nr:HAMP domain-containing histidine kinase [Thermosulfurimonas dismutans]